MALLTQRLFFALTPFVYAQLPREQAALREESLAKNEELFRKVNERIETLSQAVAQDDSMMEYLCERRIVVRSNQRESDGRQAPPLQVRVAEDRVVLEESKDMEKTIRDSKLMERASG